jgi:hypothetical protein
MNIQNLFVTFGGFLVKELAFYWSEINYTKLKMNFAPNRTRRFRWVLQRVFCRSRLWAFKLRFKRYVFLTLRSS